MEWMTCSQHLRLYLVLEGLLPFVSPQIWRQTIAADGPIAQMRVSYA